MLRTTIALIAMTHGVSRCCDVISELRTMHSAQPVTGVLVDDEHASGGVWSPVLCGFSPPESDVAMTTNRLSESIVAAVVY
jgi:hypothetical protein